MENPVLIFGAGSLGLTALDIFQRNDVVVYGLLDDNKALHGQEFGDVTVLGDTDDDGFLKLIGANSAKSCEACIAIGDGRVRKQLVKLLNDRRKVQPVNAIHDTAVISSLASLGHGNLIAARAVINPMATVGQHCLVLAGAIIDSRAQLGDFVQLGPGAVVNSGVTIEEGAYVGTGAVLVAGITVGKNARIGAGSVVVENVPAGATVFGNPAKGL
ncbi:sugar O-acyltransferase, sialic acid O-acetyltransferase NeuD family [Fibrella aestuarina BUZ 2]|uniref:Sugar O-acyltransferase, sialic acid O-acetyltransferase NeuD family n=1 Tax=Fibrella aestuarina BUZ 2 TaxID=1166018 RepID=I0K4L4_9BACT|nr:acetyltransferase [Fibrella aestuarina]CCG99067.1 sugar O-acyltransferase, sialic acid O-acetyltransferase NeuD family [Fibrella aestuarina BUZ 2]